LHVDDAIAEALGRARPAVVRLVGMEHDDVARPAALGPAAVVEHLHPGLRHADGVGVVTMRGVGALGEEGPPELDAVDRAAALHPVAPLARTFKTLGRRASYPLGHGSSLREWRATMTPEQAAAFFVFSVVAAGTPGPSNALLTTTGAHVGI